MNAFNDRFSLISRTLKTTPSRGTAWLAFTWFSSLSAFGLVLTAASVAADDQPAKTPPPAATLKAVPDSAAGAMQIAGEMIVSLDARDPSAGLATWTNQGSMGNFTRIGAPKRATVAGQPAVQFNGTSDAYRSEKPTPATICGDHARSIEVWVYNPSLDSQEECMVAWGHRGGTLTNMAFNYGSGGGFSAVTHYDEDMGWGDESPSPGQWHCLVYTYDGKLAKIYDNGIERGSQEFRLETAVGDRMNLAVENSSAGQPLFESEWEPPWSLSLSGSIAMVRVHSGALTADQVKANFNANKSRFGLARP